MKKRYLVTGADGHVGNTIIRMLRRKGEEVRGLLLAETGKESGEPRAGSARTLFMGALEYVYGDVTQEESLRPLFEGNEDREVYVIHTAGIVDISEKVSPQLYNVNVNGTRNVIRLCREYGVKRLLYVSSVHAIPEQQERVLSEVKEFDPDAVMGGYAKTKAQATQCVMDAVREGLDAVVVQPSGILGPYNQGGNHLVQMVNDYIHGRLPACVKGGYDFVDVRDVAKGCLQALEKGRTGECYILSNRHYEIKDVLRMVREIHGGRRLPVLPVWMAKATAPFIKLHARRTHTRPLYTRYSLYTLSSNDRFSHDKATQELGYRPRDLFHTLKDTVSWVTKNRRKEVTRTEKAGR